MRVKAPPRACIIRPEVSKIRNSYYRTRPGTHQRRTFLRRLSGENSLLLFIIFFSQKKTGVRLERLLLSGENREHISLLAVRFISYRAQRSAPRRRTKLLKGRDFPLQSVLHHIEVWLPCAVRVLFTFFLSHITDCIKYFLSQWWLNCYQDTQMLCIHLNRRFSSFWWILKLFLTHTNVLITISNLMYLYIYL